MQCLPVSATKGPELVGIGGLAVTARIGRDDVNSLPPCSGERPSEERLVKELVPWTLGLHDACAEKARESGGDHVNAIEDAEDGWRHHGQGPRAVFSNNPVHLLARVEEKEYCIVCRLGSTNHCGTLDLVNRAKVLSRVGRVDDGRIEVGSRKPGHHRVRTLTRSPNEPGS